MYVTTELEYYIHSEDVRMINMVHSRVAVRKSSRSIAATNNKETYELIEDEIDTLKKRCWDPM
jgi:hypothetical protein